MQPLNPDQQDNLQDEQLSAGVDQNRESALIREGMDLAETHSRHEADDTDLSGTEWPEVYDEVDQDVRPRTGADPIAPELDAIHMDRIPDTE
jgi:hypothetical protein